MPSMEEIRTSAFRRLLGERAELARDLLVSLEDLPA